MGCLNSPIQIPVGSNGLSVFIAYAADSSGTDASFTPSSSRDYISFVTKTGTVTLSNFTVWTQYQGSDGTNGTNGTGISNVYVSDGVTAIGGTVYGENTVIVLMTTGTYINAGTIQIALTWNNITLVNHTNGTGVNVAQYAIHNGFLHLRGRTEFSSSVSSTFATIAGIGNTDTLYSAGITSEGTGTPTIITLTSLGSISASNTDGTVGSPSYLYLDSIPPISIR